MRNFFLNRYRNHKKHLANLAMAAAAAASLAVGSAQAALITVPNSDFETHPGPTPNSGSISGATPWTGTGTSAWAANGYGIYAHGGTGSAWVDPSGTTITQTLTLADSGANYTWAEGTYTLDGFLRNIQAFTGTLAALDLKAELLNGTTNASLGSVTSLTTTNNTWSAMNTLTVVIGAGDPNIGAPIKILFTGLNNGNGGHRSIDDISLNFEAAVVPEPTSLALLGIATAGFGLLVRRRRSSP